MAGSRRVPLFAVVLAFWSVGAAHAQYWSCCYPPSYAFYVPEPIYSMCPCPSAAIVQAPAPAVTETKEPPVADRKPRGPILHEMKSYGGNAPPSRCKVGFWNFTDREVTLTIEDMNLTRKIPPQQSIQLDVNREFTWRIDDLPPRNDRIPDNRNDDERIVR
jgi:hypothetical protein